MHRVAITGIGIISCLGNSVEAVAEALRSGRSGIVLDEERRKLGFRSPLTGAISGFDPRSLWVANVASGPNEDRRAAVLAATETLQVTPGVVSAVLAGFDETRPLHPDEPA